MSTSPAFNRTDSNLKSTTDKDPVPVPQDISKSSAPVPAIEQPTPEPEAEPEPEKSLEEQLEERRRKRREILEKFAGVQSGVSSAGTAGTAATTGGEHRGSRWVLMWPACADSMVAFQACKLLPQDLASHPLVLHPHLQTKFTGNLISPKLPKAAMGKTMPEISFQPRLELRRSMARSRSQQQTTILMRIVKSMTVENNN